MGIGDFVVLMSNNMSTLIRVFILLTGRYWPKGDGES